MAEHLLQEYSQAEILAALVTTAPCYEKRILEFDKEIFLEEVKILSTLALLCIGLKGLLV